MIIPEKPSSSNSQVPTMRGESSQATDTRSIMTQEPPPYSESSISMLSSPPPQVISSSPRPTPSPSSSRYPPLGHPAHPQSQSSLGVPTSRGRARSFGDSQESTLQYSQPRPRSHYASQSMQQPSPPKQSMRSPPMASRSPSGPPAPQHRPNSLPGSQPLSPKAQAPPSPNPASEVPPPQHCNHLVERNDRSSVRGTWHLDTSLVIPEPLIPDISNFNGVWNEMDKKSIKQREKEKKKREGGGWGRKKIVDTTPPKVLKNEGVRPNLMLWSKDGGVQADVNLVSGTNDLAVIVAESHDGSVKLAVNAEKPQPIRLFALAVDGSVRVRIPTTFEGAISMTTQDGSVNISEGVKARLMTFTSTNKCTRAYIGDWKGADFGSPTSSPTLSSASSPQTPDSEPKDPFKNWTGPLVHLHSKDGSVHLSYVGEDTASTFSKVMKTIKDGFLGLNMEDEDGNWGNSSMVGTSPATMPLPRGLAMQAYRAPPSWPQNQNQNQAQAQVPQHPRLQAYMQTPRVQIAGPGPSEPSRQHQHVPELGGPGLFEDKRGHGRHFSR